MSSLYLVKFSWAQVDAAGEAVIDGVAGIMVVGVVSRLKILGSVGRLHQHDTLLKTKCRQRTRLDFNGIEWDFKMANQSSNDTDGDDANFAGKNRSNVRLHGND